MQNSIDGMATLEGRQEAAKQPTEFLADFFVGMLPTIRKPREFRRVAALMADVAARIHTQRKWVHSSLGKHGHDLELYGAKVTREFMMEERTLLKEDKQYASLDDLQRLKVTLSYHQPLSGTVALSAELELSLMDMALWVPVAQRYSFLPSEIVVRDRMPPEQRALALQGLSNLIAQVTEAVCFALGTSLGLPRKDLLNDLLICHDRACKLAVAWENILRKLEATAYQARAHGDVLTERLLVTAT